jgi:hypothetical protein
MKSSKKSVKWDHIDMKSSKKSVKWDHIDMKSSKNQFALRLKSLLKF